MAQAKKRIEDQTSLQAGNPEGEAGADLRLGLLALGHLIDLVASGLPADPEFWARREAGQLARSSERQRRAKLERARIARLRDGEEAAPMTGGELKTLALADAIEAKAVKGKRGAPGIRAQAARLRDVVGDAVIARTEARRADLRLEQSVALDAAREGIEPEQAHTVLETKRGTGQKRLRTRDGLALLRESDAFTPRDAEGKPRRDLAARIEADRLLAVGLRYRARYEVAQTSLKSCLASPDNPPPSSTLYAQAKASQRRAALANLVRVLDIAVVTRLGPDALLALRMVAGEARTINSITTSRRRRGRLSKALAAALVIVGDVMSGPA